jgi:phosphoribosylformylglycinamidine (FGAM) synthase-like enzyme
VRAAHDPSEGGLLPAVAEMCFAGGLGASIDLSRVPAAADACDECRAFAEDPHRYLLEVEPQHVGAVERTLSAAGVAHASIGHVTDGGHLEVVGARTARESVAIADLQAAGNAPTGG